MLRHWFDPRGIPKLGYYNEFIKTITRFFTKIAAYFQVGRVIQLPESHI